MTDGRVSRQAATSRAVLIVGMHRSGTSALTRVVSLLGADLPSRLMPPRGGANDTGFWESDDIYRLHEEILASAGSAWDDVSPLHSTWFDSDVAATFRSRMHAILRRDFENSLLFVLKDPRFCKLLPFWKTVLQEFGAEPLCVLMLRHPLEVAASLKRTHGLQTSRASLLWLRHVLDSERDSRGLRRCFVTYDQLLRDWRLVVNTMSSAFALEWPRLSHTAAADIESFLSERHRHHTWSDSRLEDCSDGSEWVSRAYAAVLAASESEDGGIRGELDPLRVEVDAADQAFGPVVAEGLLGLKTHQAKAERVGEELRGVRKRLAASEDALRERDEQITSLRPAIARVDAEARELRVQLRAQQARAGELSAELQAQQARADSLEAQLSAVYASRSWRITALPRAIKSRLQGTWTPAPHVVAPLRVIETGLQRLGVPLGKVAAPARAIRDRLPLLGAPAPGSTPTSVPDLLSERFRNTSPLNTILSRQTAVRLNLVVDSLGEASFFGGVATSLIFGSLLAHRLGCQLRVITRDSTSVPSRVHDICRLHAVPPPRKLVFASSEPLSPAGESFKIDVSDADIFLATSWWSAKAIRQATLRDRYIYLVQEYEPIFYPAGDEQLMAREILRDEQMIPVVNTRSLFRFFKERSYEHIATTALTFEPAFPRALYRPRRSSFQQKDRFRLWFYARPRMPRNLYFTGLYLLEEAIEAGTLDPASWELCLVGSDLQPVTFSDGTQPRLLGKMPWREYSQRIRDVDLGLCLMYAPTPSYPPLDLAASGGVVLTNTFTSKSNPDYSRNILWSPPERVALAEGLCRATALATDPEQRSRNFEENQLCQDWQESFAEVLERLPARLGIS